MIIYKITNVIDGKIYIGQTTRNLQRRWYEHQHKSSGCIALHNAIEKYGTSNFTVEEIDNANDRHELDEKEQFWVNYYDCVVPNGYNLKSGGHFPKYSDVVKHKMSLNHADVTENKNPMFGKHHSHDVRNKIRNAHLGKKLSDEHKRKCKEHSSKSKIVKNLDTNEIFTSSRDAEKHYGLSHGCVARVCRGEGKTSHGFRWCYTEGGDLNVKCEIIPTSNGST